MPYRVPPRYLEVHQSRRHPPTEYENRLGDALEEAFEHKAWELPQLVERLNALGVNDPHGAPWTEESFPRVMAEIAVEAAYQEGTS